jgi:hypothetical protein
MKLFIPGSTVITSSMSAALPMASVMEVEDVFGETATPAFMPASWIFWMMDSASFSPAVQKRHSGKYIASAWSSHVQVASMWKVYDAPPASAMSAIHRAGSLTIIWQSM